MTADPPRTGAGSRLTFHGPLSEQRAVRLAAELAASTPATVLDIGCGWGELMMRILAAAPAAIGAGVDSDGGDVRRARDNATARGLDGRVTFVEAPAREYLASADGRADLILNVGAYQALGTIQEALAEIRERVNPGGRVLFGAEYWERPPTEAELANMWPGITADACTDLATLAERAIAAGFGPLRIQTATRGEWEEFESGYALEREDWLLAHPGHPQAGQVRAELDKTRNIWLRGHRDVLGFAYLTLGVP
ncbi:MAG: class I SAM-dependent methyltransferase [Streptosporangiaceae bacterium]|jgi:SAM-dependent methyltransferase